MYSLLHLSLSLCSYSLSCKPLIFCLDLILQSKFNRRRGFSKRPTAVIFAATVINFFFSSLNTGNQVAGSIVLLRKALMIILDVDYPPLEKPKLINNALRNTNIVSMWVSTVPVSIRLSLLDPVSIHTRWRYCSAISLSFGGLGSFSKIDSG